MSSSWFSNLIQGRGESSGLLVAFSVGAFSILVILAEEFTMKYSPAWIALSIAYWLIVISAFLTVRAWAWHAMIIEYHSKPYNQDEMPKHLRESLHKDRENPLVRFSVADFSDGSGKVMKVFVVAAAIGILVIGALLYVTIAFKFFVPI
jgi:hypothetical protein